MNIQKLIEAASEEEYGMSVPQTNTNKKRANWGKGANIVILIKAVHDCYNNAGDNMESNNEKFG